MKQIHQVLILIIVLLFAGNAWGGEIEVKRLTQKVIVLNERNPLGLGYITAISTEQGIVVVDTHASLEVMKRIKAEIERIFNRNDYCYVINTHEHLEHLSGNVLFTGTTIIGHDNLETGARKLIPKEIAHMEEHIAWSEAELKNLDENSAEAKQLKESCKYSKERVNFLKSDFKLVPPHLTFSDRLTIDCGDIEIKLIYFGKGHTDSDIIVYIPKEGVAVVGGALKYTIPPKMYANPENDYQRWFAVMEELLDDANKLEYIVPGHYDIMSKKELGFVYAYLKEIWHGIRELKQKGVTFKQCRSEFSLEKRFSDFREFQDISDDMRSRHNKNIEIVWDCLNSHK